MSIRQGSNIISGNGSGLPNQSGQSGKYLRTDGTTASWEDASTTQIWIGTKDEYDALESHDPDVVYQITDDYVVIKPFSVSERDIGEFLYSLVPITDSCVHLLDGSLLDGEGIYSQFYEHMKDVYDSGHTSIFVTEAAWQTSNTTYGKCGKFVLDTTNHTIRLPKILGFVEGTLTESEIGNLVEAGLPNITGGLSIPATYGSASATGAISVSNQGTTGSNNPVAKSGDLSITLNASRSSSVYGNSTTVQPEAIKVYAYIVIANTVKTPIEVDIDEVATDLAGKVDKGHQVIAFQEPTSTNNYTWYRKYADGWVEQGGYVQPFTGTGSVNLPITMQNTNYFVSAIADQGSKIFAIPSRNTTYFGIQYTAISGSSAAGAIWMVCGMAA